VTRSWPNERRRKPSGRAWRGGRTSCWLLAQFGRVQAALGASRHADAFELAERLFDVDDPAYHPVMASWLIADLAEAAFHLDRLEEGRARVAQVEAQSRENPGVWIALGLRHARAILAEGSEATADRFAEAFAADLGPGPSSERGFSWLMGSGCGGSVGLPSRVHRFAQREKRSMRSAARPGAIKHAGAAGLGRVESAARRPLGAG